jgi:hypothetical protein
LLSPVQQAAAVAQYARRSHRHARRRAGQYFPHIRFLLFYISLNKKERLKRPLYCLDFAQGGRAAPQHPRSPVRPALAMVIMHQKIFHDISTLQAARHFSGALISSRLALASIPAHPGQML